MCGQRTEVGGTARQAGFLQRIADFIGRVLAAPADAKNLEAVRAEVIALTARFPVYR